MISVDQVSKFIRVKFPDGYIEPIVLGWKVQPVGTRCIDFEWRSQLKPKDRVDVMDKASIWITSTVLELLPNSKILIGFRIEKPKSTFDE